MPRLSALRQRFEQIFNETDEALRVFFAPGRVNLIGEHTDFTGGYVLPAALTYGTWAVVRRRKDRKFRLASTSFDERVEFDATGLDYRSSPRGSGSPDRRRGRGARCSAARCACCTTP
ncbi:MAG TPA: hypothetical protein DD730_10070 [Desulfosporosinus sp.]|nr:hypothetical protein [Desulfosporosinus sp.]